MLKKSKNQKHHHWLVQHARPTPHVRCLQLLLLCIFNMERLPRQLRASFLNTALHQASWMHSDVLQFTVKVNVVG